MKKKKKKKKEEESKQSQNLQINIRYYTQYYFDRSYLFRESKSSQIYYFDFF